MAEAVHWTTFTYDNWTLYIAKSKDGLCYIGLPEEPYEQMAEWVRKKMGNAQLVENREEVQPYIEELEEYLGGERKAFSFPLDFQGTAFQKEVWTALMQIPYGETCSYSDIAELIERPKAVRAVGAALGANPVAIIVPCHRVIGKNGNMTGYRGGLKMKQFLLELETKNHTHS